MSLAYISGTEKRQNYIWHPQPPRYLLQKSQISACNAPRLAPPCKSERGGGDSILHPLPPLNIFLQHFNYIPRPTSSGNHNSEICFNFVYIELNKNASDKLNIRNSFFFKSSLTSILCENIDIYMTRRRYKKKPFFFFQSA